MVTKKILYLIAGISLLFLLACAPKPRAPQAVLDTPEHHVSNGNKFLKAERINEAFSEFRKAIELDPKFSAAYAGLGIVYGLRNDFENGFKNMEKAEDNAEGNTQEMAVNIGFIRLYTMGGDKVDKKWLKKVTDRFEDAVKIDPAAAAPYYYMGIAYKMAFEFNDSVKQFSKVLELDKQFVAEADKAYALVQKIQRAMPGSKVGKAIALLEKITRADTAALFIEELKVDELFRNRTKKVFDTSFKSPEKEFKTGEYVKIPPATDIADHVLKADIDEVIKLEIKGLQPFSDHQYKPYANITRAEFAIMIEDILIKIIRDDKLATKFIGSESPFPDLRNSLPYFNAAMVCTTRNIIETVDVSTGEFQPNGTVSGADALLSIRILKNQLKKY